MSEGARLYLLPFAAVAGGCHCLEEAAGAGGDVGFAVGRTVWFDALADHMSRRVDRAAATRPIAERCLETVAAYAQCAVSNPAPAADVSRAPDTPNEAGRA
ncbi:MAG: hypothetical protein ACR2KC_02200 [Acidimicrobiales bacterium]